MRRGDKRCLLNNSKRMDKRMELNINGRSEKFTREIVTIADIY